MKKILLFISLFVLSCLSSFSQSSCAGAAPFCTASGTTFPASTGTTAPVGPNYGCLGSEPNPAWYYLQISAAGNININLSNSAGVDIDFCSWGPFATQAAMCPGTSGAPFDCSYSTAATEQVNIVGAVVGQWYMVLITNYANVPTNISATTTGGTTGATNCAILCNMTGLTAIPGACNPATNLYTLSGTITTTTPPTTGTLTITNSCGGSQVLNPAFSTSIAYSFPGMTSNGAGCSITATYSADPTCTLTTGYTSPASCTGCIIAAGPAQTVCGSDVINLTTSSAGAGYTYSWTGPGGFVSGVQNPTGVVVPAAAGTYTYNVTATSGGTNCTSSTTVTVNPTPIVNAEPNLTFCDGVAVPANTFASAPAGATFAWTNSNTAIGLAASGITSTPAFTATNATGGAISGTITITPTLAGCVGTPSTYTITVNPIPVAPTALGSSVCANTSTTLTATAPGGTYSWYDAPGGTLLITNPSYTTPNLTVNTTYYVQSTVLGCTGPFSPVIVTIAPGLIVNAGINDSVCFGGNTILTVTPNGGGNTYAWTPAGSLSNAAIFNPTASPAATTIYSVTVTDPAGCVGTDNVTVYADPQITLAIAGINVTCNGACNGQTIVIPAGGTPAYSYLWSSGCVAASCNLLCPTSYTVTVTDLWGCTATANTVVTEPTLFTASITASAPTSCNGVCDGSATAAGNGGTVGGGYSYSWNTVPVQNTATATGLCVGSYICTITDANLCTTTTPITITEPTLVVIAPIVSPTICFAGTVNVVASASGGNGGPYSYTWSPATGLDFTNIANPNASPVGTTIYTVNATDNNGCPAASVNVTVTVNPPLTVISAGTASICPGASTPISAVAANGGGGPYTYSWFTSAGLSAANIANPSASPASTTTYTVTASDGCSPNATATVIVTVLPLPVVAFTGDLTSGCSPLCVTFTDHSTVAGSTVATWAWDFGDGSPIDNTQNPPLHCYNTNGFAGNFTVGLTATSTLGGCTSTSSYPAYITIFADPVAEFNATPSTTTVLDPIVLLNNQSSADVNYWFWDFGDGDTLGYTTSDPTHAFPSGYTGIYNVQLIVQNANGCGDTISHPVTIGPEFTFFIPNAFSPNGDGVNDGFLGTGIGIEKYELYVFDRWGNLIFFADELNKAWDGKANHGGDMAQQDVYIWKVKLTDVFGKKHDYIGTVTIVK